MLTQRRKAVAVRRTQRHECDRLWRTAATPTYPEEAMRGEYLIVLLGSLVAVTILDRIARLGVFRQWRRLLVALIPTAIAILAWDLLGVLRWHWASNDAYLLGPHGFGGRIPLEEFLFPLVVAACALTLWELIGTRLRPRRDADGEGR